MITPRFEVSQDDEFIHLVIYTSRLQTSSLEFVVEGNVFVFSLSPYYLRLRFSGRLVDEDDRTTSKYELDRSAILISIPKETKNEHFEDLDMLSKLLARTDVLKGGKETNKGPLIQEIQALDVHDETAQSSQGLLQEAEAFDWEIEQHLSEDLPIGLKAQYGFNNAYNGVIGLSVMNGNDINQEPNPEATCTGTSLSRKDSRVECENEKFDLDYYIADLMDNEQFLELIEDSFSRTDLSSSFTSQEQDRLHRLAYKEYLLDNPKMIYLGLVCIIFAYAYDLRTTSGEHNIQSPWTIGAICPLFGALDGGFSTIVDAEISCSRRALCYPLYRNWQLIEKVWQDTYTILKSGKHGILKVLLSLQQIFEADPYYVYNTIWINDYCCWIQQSNDQVIRSLAHEIHKASIVKGDLGWDLDNLETNHANIE